MKEYEITFDGTEYTEKPTGNEIKKINSNLNTVIMEYKKIADFVVRGELLESYPDTRIYLSTLEVDQKSKTDVFNPWCYSTMTTYLTDSILLVGFSGISRDELRNKYLTFEEADNSLRFTYQPKNSSSCAKDSRYWAKQRLYDATIWGYPAWEIASGTPS